MASLTLRLADGVTDARSMTVQCAEFIGERQRRSLIPERRTSLSHPRAPKRSGPNRSKRLCWRNSDLTAALLLQADEMAPVRYTPRGRDPRAEEPVNWSDHRNPMPNTEKEKTRNSGALSKSVAD